MLQIKTSFDRIDFRQLCRVYSDELLNAGKKDYPYFSENLQILEAEQDFYHFLSEFFRLDDAFYAIWIEEGRYQSALRVEPYQDGVIFTGLQTALESRNKGYASALMEETLRYLSINGVCRVYSHIRKDNRASIQCHIENGFEKILDYSVYINGDVDRHCHTYLKKLPG